MNSWAFTGNLGRDGELRHSSNGTEILSFSVAVKSGYGQSEQTTWARCALFGKRATALQPHLTKGTQVGIVGEVSMREWQDKDGLTRSSLEVRVNDLTLLSRAEGSGMAKEYAPQPQRTQAPQPIEDLDDSIPF